MFKKSNNINKTFVTFVCDRIFKRGLRFEQKLKLINYDNIILLN